MLLFFQMNNKSKQCREAAEMAGKVDGQSTT